MTAAIPMQSRFTAERPRSAPPAAPGGRDLTALAADLHDGLAQELFAARMLVDEVLASAELSMDTKATLEQLSDRLAGSSHTLRTALLRWRRSGTSAPPPRPVVDRVRDCVREFEGAHGIPTAVTVSGHGPAPEPAGTELLARTVREALANVAKHAQASRAIVTLDRGPLWWTVTVEDDGRGEPALVRSHTRAPVGLAFGLMSLADQAARAAGGLAVGRSRRLGGLLVRMSVPAERTAS